MVPLLSKLANGCKAMKRKLLLLCDESEALVGVGRTDPGFLGQLRTVFQDTGRIRTVLSGTRMLGELGHRFLSGFEPFTFLPCFTPAETEGLVRLGLEPNATVLKGVYEATGGHPYFAQAVCHKMFDGESNIDTAKERVYLEFRSLIDGILEQDYSYLSDDERRILTSLSEEGPANASDLSRRVGLGEEETAVLLSALLQSSYLKCGEDARYAFLNDFLSWWLSKKTPSSSAPASVSKEAILMLAADLQTVYEDFVLLISSRTSRRAEYPIHVISSPAGETSDRTQLNSVWKRIQEALRKIEAGHRGTRLFQDVGTALFDAIFGGAIGELYRTSEGYAQGRGYGLRLRLRVEPPELSFLPWELLFDSFHDRFVARWPNRPLSRLRRNERLTAAPRNRATAPLAGSHLQPREFGGVSSRRTRCGQREKPHRGGAARMAHRAGVLKIEAMDHAIVSEIGDRLRDFRPHLLHFIGHGSFRKVRREDRGCIVLEDVKRRCKLIDEKVFAEMLDAEMTRLVVLNACETATSSSLRALSGMAARLVQVGMSAVVAMRVPIVDTPAIKFSREFYRAIASGLAVDARRRRRSPEVGSGLRGGSPLLVHSGCFHADLGRKTLQGRRSLDAPLRVPENECRRSDLNISRKGTPVVMSGRGHPSNILDHRRLDSLRALGSLPEIQSGQRQFSIECRER